MAASTTTYTSPHSTSYTSPYTAPPHTYTPRPHSRHTPATRHPISPHLPGPELYPRVSWRLVIRKPVVRFFSLGGTVEDTSMLHSTLHIHSRPLHVTHIPFCSLLPPLHPSHPLLSPPPLSPLLLPSPWSGCCSLVEMGTCAYCHWSWKRRRRGREDGAVANPVQLPAASSSCRGLLVG